VTWIRRDSPSARGLSICEPPMGINVFHNFQTLPALRQYPKTYLCKSDRTKPASATSPITTSITHPSTTFESSKQSSTPDLPTPPSAMRIPQTILLSRWKRRQFQTMILSGGVCGKLTTENQKVRADDREERVISLDRYFTDANSLYPTLFIAHAMKSNPQLTTILSS